MTSGFQHHCMCDKDFVVVGEPDDQGMALTITELQPELGLACHRL